VAYNGKMYIFGGADNNSPGLLNDLWEYDITTDSWAQKNSAPFSRADHSATVEVEK
jgi:N-acetylneuraminic acid mutarotase